MKRLIKRRKCKREKDFWQVRFFVHFGAAWLWSGHPVTIRAYNVSDQAIDLSSTPLVDTFYGSGPTSWNGASGQLTMFGGAPSEHGGIVDLSGLSIDRVDLSYSTATWDGFSFGIANNKVAPVPEPATMLLFGTGLAGLVGTRIRREKK